MSTKPLESKLLEEFNPTHNRNFVPPDSNFYILAHLDSEANIRYEDFHYIVK